MSDHDVLDNELQTKQNRNLVDVHTQSNSNHIFCTKRIILQKFSDRGAFMWLVDNTKHQTRKQLAVDANMEPLEQTKDSYLKSRRVCESLTGVRECGGKS